ncbi:MAG: alpha-L-fucosidase [Planctomycetota bacterium]
MRTWIARCACLAAIALAPSRLRAEEPAAPVAAPKAPPNAERLEWWRAARFGMFVHWGPVSLKGTEIGWSRGAEVPVEEYDNLYKRFNPVLFDAGEWVGLAKDAGMKYLVFTTKHHDGFCMWDTKQTEYNILRSPFARDVVGELAAACRKHGIAFGTYHSVCDWHHPDFPLGSPGGRVRKPSPNLDRYTEYLRAQVAELVQNYGPLLILWFDVPQEFDAKRGQALVDYTRSLQPDIIVNDRAGVPGDYSTPEQRIGNFNMDRPWETCMTICEQWAWKPGDRLKSFAECIGALARCAGGDGNLLLNVGPMPDGRIEPRQAERLREMGAWLAKYGESIYGTRGGPYHPTSAVASTRRGNAIFLHVLRWPEGELRLPPLPKKVVACSLLSGGEVEFRETGDALAIRVSPTDRDPADTVVRLDLDGPALEIPPIDARPKVQATASNVYQRMPDFGPEAAFDGDLRSRWATDAGTHKAWISIEFERPKTIRGVRIREAYPGRVRKFELQAKHGTEWKAFASGDGIGEDFSKEFPPVAARALRLEILEATEGPTIWEIEWLEAK